MRGVPACCKVPPQPHPVPTSSVQICKASCWRQRKYFNQINISSADFGK